LAKIAIVGGSGLEKLIEEKDVIEIETKYGKPPAITVGTINGSEISFVSRHGPKHEVPPHKVNYRALIMALKDLGVERIIATNAVGAINKEYVPGDIAVPIDIMDFTRTRQATFYDSGPVTHVDVTAPYCQSLRKILIKSAKNLVARVWTDSVMVCTEGPRFETPAEIRMFGLLGGDLVGMTSAPEVFLAREAGLCYASIAFVSNKAAGMQNQISQREVEEVASKTAPAIRSILSRSIQMMSNMEPCHCRERSPRG